MNYEVCMYILKEEDKEKCNEIINNYFKIKYTKSFNFNNIFYNVFKSFVKNVFISEYTFLKLFERKLCKK